MGNKRLGNMPEKRPKIFNHTVGEISHKTEDTGRAFVPLKSNRRWICKETMKVLH